MRRSAFVRALGTGWVVAAWAVVGCEANSSGEQAAANLHVIAVSVDGLGGDQLEALLHDDAQGRYGNFKRFVDEGASTFNARADYTHTLTLPNHTCMLSGRPTLPSLPRKRDRVGHGYTKNGMPAKQETLHSDGNANLKYISSVFDVLHDHGVSTGLYASKYKFVLFDRSFDAKHGAADTIAADNGRDKIDVYRCSEDSAPDGLPETQLVFRREMQRQPVQFAFVHYAAPDAAGHSFGWGGKQWNDAVAAVDRCLGDLFELLSTHPQLRDNTIVVLTADHGGWEKHHADAARPQNCTIPFFVWGRGVARGADLYALNATTRLDPGGDCADYTTSQQPIRNGEIANLVLGLFGLGAVPGSSINAQQDLAVLAAPQPHSAQTLKTH